MIDSILTILLCIAPLYFANAAALFFGGGKAIDFGKRFFDGRPIFGEGKTIKGTILAIGVATAAVLTINHFLPNITNKLIGDYVMYGFLLSLGAVVGDIAASFFKRRFNVEQGKPVLLLDQLDFVVGGLLFGSVLFIPSIWELAVIIIFSMLMHKFTNYIAFEFQLKKVPW